MQPERSSAAVPAVASVDSFGSTPTSIRPRAIGLAGGRGAVPRAAPRQAPRDHADEPLLLRWAWIPVNAIHAVYVATWTAVWITLALIVRRVSGSPDLPLRMARTCWAPGLTGPGRYRVTVENRGEVDLEKPCLLACNHRSALDIVALFRALPVPLRFVVKAELARVPFLGAYIRAMGMVFVERRRGARAARGISRVREILEEGACVVAFPEGTRSRNGQVLPFHTGALVQAIEAGVPIVPVALSGTEKALPPGGFRPRPKRDFRLVLGEPLSTGDLEVGQRRQIAREVRHRVVDLLASMEAPAPRESGSAIR